MSQTFYNGNVRVIGTFTSYNQKKWYFHQKPDKSVGPVAGMVWVSVDVAYNFRFKTAWYRKIVGWGKTTPQPLAFGFNMIARRTIL